jgi:aryl-alcohol dehydrogenase-like predicted oxidoreductase
MKYKLLGRSGLRASELALGTMTFGEDWGWGASKQACQQIFDMFRESGGNFIDTACNYTEGTSEKFVGEFVASERDYYVIATKYTLRSRGENAMDPNAGGNHRKNLMRSVESSLKRLNTEYIDLLYLHMWDYTTSVNEVMRGLDDLVREGKVHYIGFSDTPAYIVAKANMLADLQSLSPVVAIQVPYNLVRRDPERELFPMAREEDIAVTAWGLLGGGVLTGKYRQVDLEKRYDHASEDSMVIADKLVKIGKQIGRSPSQIAINWVRQQKDKAQIIPIIGARSAEQFKDNLGVLDFELSPEQLQEITELSDFKIGFPWSFLHEESVLELVHGKTYPDLDLHR